MLLFPLVTLPPVATLTGTPLSMKREDRDLCSMLNLTDFHQGFALPQ